MAWRVLSLLAMRNRAPSTEASNVSGQGAGVLASVLELAGGEARAERTGGPGAEPKRYPRLDVPAFFRPASWLDAIRAASNPGVGVRAWTDEKLPVGSRWVVELVLDQGRAVSCIVRTAWRAPLPESAGAAFEVGFDVIDGDPTAIERLRSLG